MTAPKEPPKKRPNPRSTKQLMSLMNKAALDMKNAVTKMLLGREVYFLPKDTKSGGDDFTAGKLYKVCYVNNKCLICIYNDNGAMTIISKVKTEVDIAKTHTRWIMKSNAGRLRGKK